MSEAKVSKFSLFVAAIVVVWAVDGVRHHEFVGQWSAIAREIRDVRAALGPRAAIPQAQEIPAPASPRAVDEDGMTAEERAGAAKMFAGLASIDRWNEAKIRTLSADAVNALRDPRARARLAEDLTASPSALKRGDDGQPKGGEL